MLIVDLTLGKARIGIVTAASEDPQGSADFYLDHFSTLGAQVYWIPVHLNDLGAASDPEVVQEVYQVLKLTIVPKFFSSQTILLDYHINYISSTP